MNYEGVDEAFQPLVAVLERRLTVRQGPKGPLDSHGNEYIVVDSGGITPDGGAAIICRTKEQAIELWGYAVDRFIADKLNGAPGVLEWRVTPEIAETTFLIRAGGENVPPLECVGWVTYSRLSVYREVAMEAA